MDTKIAKASVAVCRELLYSSGIAETFAARNQGSLLASLQVLGNKLSEILFQLIISLPIVVGIHDLILTFQLSCMTRTDTSSRDTDMGLAPRLYRVG